jgi:hypothetical protein
MIVIIIVRRAVCEVCQKTWDLEWGEDPPSKCKLCGSKDWEEAPEIRDAIYIRKGITKKKRRLNPGAASGARQERGKKQWRRFKDKEGNPV